MRVPYLADQQAKRINDMAIYGIGAFINSETDVSANFVKRGVACVHWDQEDAPAVHRLLGHIKTGDILYIKAHPPGRSLTVKAVGIVEKEPVELFGDLGRGLHVRWLWRGPEETWPESDEEIRYNVRANTLYEEYSQTVQTRILELLFSAFREVKVSARPAAQR
jgi:hypothetical protein